MVVKWVTYTVLFCLGALMAWAATEALAWLGLPLFR
jgi:hypothetical protein